MIEEEKLHQYQLQHILSKQKVKKEQLCFLQEICKNWLNQIGHLKSLSSEDTD